MDKAKEISALWEQVKTQVGELVGLCCEVEDHAEVTADAYQMGYEQGRKEMYAEWYKKGMQLSIDDAKLKEAYKKGLSDAWECAKKIAYMYSEERKKVFGENLIRKIQDIYSASECIEKIRQYEQEKEEQIQVGDEVIIRNKTAVVTEITDRYVRIMYSDGSCYALFSKGIVKTGRHFPEIAEVLAKMKE